MTPTEPYKTRRHCPCCGTSFAEQIIVPNESITCSVCGDTRPIRQARCWRTGGRVDGEPGGKCIECNDNHWPLPKPKPDPKPDPMEFLRTYFTALGPNWANEHCRNAHFEGDSIVYEAKLDPPLKFIKYDFVLPEGADDAE